MARIRSIHPDACKSEKLSDATDGAERCYWRLQVHCDDEGRCEDNPRLLRSYMFPLRDKVKVQTVDSWLTELAGLGLIVRYQADDGRRYVQVTRWKLYQKPRRPMASPIPAPRPRDLRIPDIVGTSADNVGTCDVHVPPGVGEGVEGSGYKEREGECEGEPRLSSFDERKVVGIQERARQINARYGDGL